MHRLLPLLCLFSFLFLSPLFADELPPPAAPDATEVARDIQKAFDRALVEEPLRMTIGLHTPWHIVHGLLAYGDKLLLRDPKKEAPVSALDWIRDGGIWRDQPSFLSSPSGFHGNLLGPQFEGHLAQFAGYLSELQLDWKTPFKAWNQKDRVWETRPLSKLYEEIKAAVTPREAQTDDNESSWALWALARSGFAKVDETWKNAAGEEVNFEKLVYVETFRDLEDAACGGVHGLYAMSLALQLYKKTGKALTGSWLVADYLEQKYLRQAKKQQAADGAFSADYFYGPREAKDWRDSLPGNGHIFEWLMLVLPDAALREEWVLRGAHSVAKNLLAAEIDDADIEGYLGVLGTDLDEKKEDALFERYMTLGGYFHAAHGLRMYRDRLARLR